MMYSEGPHNLDALISFVLLFAVFSQIDIVFDDDQGFYRTLKQLIRSAKCPVVLTCNGPPSLFWIRIHADLVRSSICILPCFLTKMQNTLKSWKRTCPR